MKMILPNKDVFVLILDTYDYGRKTDVRVNLPTAPRAARGPENDANIPKEPPFQAYLSNLSYDVTEDDLAAFFAELKVSFIAFLLAICKLFLSRLLSNCSNPS